MKAFWLEVKAQEAQSLNVHAGGKSRHGHVFDIPCFKLSYYKCNYKYHDVKLSIEPIFSISLCSKHQRCHITACLFIIAFSHDVIAICFDRHE
jgi:hypothetical protein